MLKNWYTLFKKFNSRKLLEIIIFYYVYQQRCAKYKIYAIQ